MQRPLILAGSVAAAMLALYSCSMRASLTTDGDGRVVEVSSLRIESSLSRWTIGMLIAGGQLAFELRRMRPSSEQTRTGIDCADEFVPGRIVGSQMA